MTLILLSEILHQVKEGEIEVEVSCAGIAEGGGKRPGVMLIGKGNVKRNMDDIHAPPTEHHGAVTGGFLRQSSVAVWFNNA